MSWTAISPSISSWGASLATVVAWTSVTASRVPPSWGILTSQTTAVDQGVDFQLLIREQYPIYLSEDRPVYIHELQPEGSE